ncbi:PIN domain nuclease [Sphaerotilus sp.]|uniref:type II toxin-antitoxin system VapC family toxin n=1 Tax=Sphaerotilus sp. TaxID=2093942 RepID=UPI002ACD5AC1|nr:PIN domain nuclease [Sphaerotilus sp.]MDZ7855898.1 PIN domain nuclease [Sphaerotilus sp.]
MLVDTSVWIDFFNGHASAQAERLTAAIADGEPIALPGLVITEILLGLKSDAEAAKVLGLLDAFDAVAEPARSDYVAAARLYRQCRAKGFTIRSTIDCLIAQLCLRDGLVLLTKDRDFEAIAGCSALRLVAA